LLNDRLADAIRSSASDVERSLTSLSSGISGVLKQNAYQRWPDTAPPQVADLHLMLMQKVYGCPDTSFGKVLGSMYPAGLSQPTEILA